MRTYTLLALAGLAPQVVTEAVWSLARQHHPPFIPSAVEVIATGVGEAHGRALLLGEPRIDPVSGEPIPHAADRWKEFCQEVLGQRVPLRFHVPDAGGQPLTDVTGVDADRRFADLCYHLVAQLTAPDQPPLVGSLAGGRKTLSAHLMTAFAVYARPQDRLIHVLVHPASAERNADFFYPRPGSEVRVHRIDVPFPRLRTLLSTSAAGEALARGADLRELLAILQPLLDAEQTPESFVLAFKRGHATLAAAVHQGDLGTVRLTPAETATLLVVADAGGENGRIRLDALVGDVATEAQRTSVLAACGRFEPLRPWSAPADVSKAVSRLNRSLAESPLLARFFSVESDVQREATYYRLAEPLPVPLSTSASSRLGQWPFTNILAPSPLK